MPIEPSMRNSLNVSRSCHGGPAKEDHSRLVFPRGNNKEEEKVEGSPRLTTAPPSPTLSSSSQLSGPQEDRSTSSSSSKSIPFASWASMSSTAAQDAELRRTEIVELDAELERVKAQLRTTLTEAEQARMAAEEHVQRAADELRKMKRDCEEQIKIVSQAACEERTSAEEAFHSQLDALSQQCMRAEKQAQEVGKERETLVAAHASSLAELQASNSSLMKDLVTANSRCKDWERECRKMEERLGDAATSAKEASTRAEEERLAMGTRLQQQEIELRQVFLAELSAKERTYKDESSRLQKLLVKTEQGAAEELKRWQGKAAEWATAESEYVSELDWVTQAMEENLVAMRGLIQAEVPKLRTKLAAQELKLGRLALAQQKQLKARRWVAARLSCLANVLSIQTAFAAWRQAALKAVHERREQEATGSFVAVKSIAERFNDLCRTSKMTPAIVEAIARDLEVRKAEIEDLRKQCRLPQLVVDQMVKQAENDIRQEHQHRRIQDGWRADLRAVGLRIQEVSQDGSCFFHCAAAVSSSFTSLELRQAAVEKAVQEWALDTEWADRMKLETEFADDIAMQATAMVMNRSIWVFAPSGVTFFQGAGDPILVAFNGTNHHDLLRR